MPTALPRAVARAALALAAAATVSLPLAAQQVERATPAGLSRSGLVAPAPRPGVAADTSTSEFDVSGVKVILRQIEANDVIAAQVYLLGGSQQLTPRTAGIETLLLAASERGTRHFSKDALRRITTRLGSEFTIEPTVDYTMFGVRTVRSALDSSWALLADRLMAPTLDSMDVELVRAQLVSAARQRRDTPDALVDALADSLLWTGRPYALDPTGTVESLAAITRQDLLRYEREQMVTSRMLVVVVGNVDSAHVARLVRATLATLPRGSYAWTAPAPAYPSASRVASRQASLPTNYVLGYYAGPPATSPDYQALRVATAVLAGRLFTEIRSRRNLSYAVDAPFIEHAASVGELYVTTVSPDTTLAIMQTEIARLQIEQLDPEGLERLVQQFITEFFLNNETNAAQASFLARAALLRGDYREAERFVDELRHVTPADVQRVARLYMHNVQFAYVGDTTRMPQRRMLAF